MKTFGTFILIWIFADHTSTNPFTFDNNSVFGTTTIAAAKKDFDRGLLLLHNFEYPDARELFRGARKKDPLFALAYWGEAMTYNHPIWHNQDAASAREVIRKYKETSQAEHRSLSPLDADLITSLDFLYGEDTKGARDKAYADFMSTLFEKYKGNHEVAAFYALSLLGLTEGWNTDLCNRAADIAGAILKADPAHPGALHYFIHAEDHPEYAQLAWEQANAYAKVASYSGHALHMPSHIYLALGLWDDVVNSNEVSWRAGVDRKAAKKLNNDALNYHGHWWLEYGYLQQGRFGKAQEILKSQLRFTRELPSPSARNHFVIMRGHYLMETNDWQNSIVAEEIKSEDLRIEIRTLDKFIKGLIAYRAANENTLEKIIAQIENDIAKARQRKVMNDGIEQCGAANYPQSGIDQATILHEELMALLSFMNNDHLSARAHFKKAIDLEDESGHFFGPPEILKPTYEFYGEFLLATGHPEQAMASFEKSLQKSPGRNQALRGLRASSHLTGDQENETKAGENLRRNLRNAESSAPVTGFFVLP